METIRNIICWQSIPDIQNTIKLIAILIKYKIIEVRDWYNFTNPNCDI